MNYEVKLPDKDTFYKLKIINAINSNYLISGSGNNTLIKNNIDCELEILDEIAEQDKLISVKNSTEIDRLLNNLYNKIMLYLSSNDVLELYNYIVDKHKNGKLSNSSILTLCLYILDNYEHNNFRYNIPIKCIDFLNRFIVYVTEIIFKDNNDSKLKNFIFDFFDINYGKHNFYFKYYYGGGNSEDVYNSIDELNKLHTIFTFIKFNLKGLLLFDDNNRILRNMTYRNDVDNFSYIERNMVTLIVNLLCGEYCNNHPTAIKELNYSTHSYYPEYNILIGRQKGDITPINNEQDYCVRFVNTRGYTTKRSSLNDSLIVTDNFKKFFSELIDSNIVTESYDLLLNRIIKFTITNRNVKQFKFLFSLLSSCIIPISAKNYKNFVNKDFPNIVKLIIKTLNENKNFIRRLGVKFNHYNYNNDSIWRKYSKSFMEDIPLANHIIISVLEEGKFTDILDKKSIEKFEKVKIKVFKEILK